MIPAYDSVTTGISCQLYRCQLQKRYGTFISLQVSGQELAQRAAAAGAAVLLSAGMAAPALATEFDILGEPTPTKAYFVDDASVLSKSTKSELNKKLGILEVRSHCDAAVTQRSASGREARLCCKQRFSCKEH
jgi:hypothetical protein